MSDHRSLTVLVLASAGVLAVQTARAQEEPAVPACAHPARAWLVAGLGAAGGGLFALSQKDSWWPDGFGGGFPVRFFERSPSREQDRLLHAYVAYRGTQVVAVGFDWACENRRTASLLAFASLATASLSKEIGDGLAEGHQFSVGELLVAWSSAALAVARARGGAFGAFDLKLSYWPSEEYRKRPADSDQPTRTSDYAGQRYWLSFHPGRLSRSEEGLWWPRWLGIALGHGSSAWVPPQRPDTDWFLALDLNLADVFARPGALHRLASVLDAVHLPLPAVRWRDGKAIVLLAF